MSKSVRVDTTISHEYWAKTKALKLEKGTYSEAMRRGLTLIFDEIEGRNLLRCSNLDVAVPIAVIQKVNKLSERIQELAAENEKLRIQAGVAK